MTVPETCRLFADDGIQPPPGATLALYRDGAQITPEPTLGLADRAHLQLATTHLVLRWVRPAALGRGALFESLDTYFTKVLSLTFMLHLFLLAGLWLSLTHDSELSSDVFTGGAALRKVVLPTPPPRPSFVTSVHVRRPRGGAAQPGPLSAANRVERPVTRPQRATGGRAVLSAGLLSGLGTLDQLVAGSHFNALDALKGPSAADNAPGFGTHHGGSQSGGPIDIGGLPSGTRWSGGGGYRPHGLSFGSGQKTATAIVPAGQPSVQDNALAKDVIAAIIRKHQNEIRYCYEVALEQRPGLNGKVSVAFTIAATGEVSDAAVNETTLNEARVEDCLVRKIRRWTFPEPKGGGQVFVTYPWIFKPAGVEE